jgi:hypothetical protein
MENRAGTKNHPRLGHVGVVLAVFEPQKQRGKEAIRKMRSECKNPKVEASVLESNRGQGQA